MPFKSDKRLYVNADRSKIVEEDSPEAAYLLVGEGGQVSDEDAKKYGLKAPKAEAKAEEPESKQVAEPPQNKAQTMRSGKDT
jgi:hypothetical protein